MSEFKERRQALITALRSGDYKQGRERLRNLDNEFCCLGVACDIYHKATGEGEWENESGLRPTKFKVNTFGSRYELPDAVRIYYGFTTESGHFKFEGKPNSLANLNDSKKYNFSKIADIIEESPEGLFFE
jgi:hypothetical protein